MELLFVYNAKSGLKAAAIDYFHKIIHPSTYPCHLCALTYSNIGERKVWKEFVKNSAVKMTFHHIDDFEAEYNYTKNYPVILIKEKNTLTSFLDKNQINNIHSIENLISFIDNNVNLK